MHLPPQKSVLSSRGLAVGYGQPGCRECAVLSSVDLEVTTGALICVVGPNGVGKSTLLRTLGGLQPALAGEITLLGKALHTWEARERARKIAIVLTGRLDAGFMTVRSVVALGRFPYAGAWGRLQSEDRCIIEEALHSVAIAHLAERLFSRLSDGEQQKVLIARALAQKPLMLVLDEPTAYLDVTGRAEMMNTLRRLSRRTDHAVVVSTHDIDLAMRTADALWLIGCDGRLRLGAPEDLVLSGEFASVFHADGASFDARSGSFKFNSRGGGSAAVGGSGLALEWTRRAMQRLGFAVVAGGEPAEVHVELSDSRRATGTVAVGNERYRFASIAELSAVLTTADHEGRK